MVRRYCQNFRCLFRETCHLATPPIEGEQVRPFVSEKDDIYCEHYSTKLTKYELTDHTQQRIEKFEKKYGIKKNRVV